LSLYEFLLFAHIAGAVIWVGGGTMIQFFAFRALRSDDTDRIANLASDIEWVGSRILVPTSLLTFLLGVGLVWESDAIGFGDDWIVIGLVLFAVTFLAGAGFFGPESGRIAKLVALHGAGSPAAQARIRRILILSRIDLVVLFLIIFEMSVKPSFSDGWTLTLALVAAVALALLLTVRRRPAPETAAASR
jgi:uncharacterized membrane protein